MSDNQYVSEDERWEYLVTSLILGDPFIHEFIIMMSKHPDESIKTMGVCVKDARINLAYAPSFLAKLTDSEARWVLVHEILHLVFHHCTVRSSTDPRLHKLDNIACDLAINQLIPEDGRIMKPRPEVITPYFPDALNFPEKLSKEQYFQLLIEKDKKEDGNNGQGQGQPQQGQGNGQSQDPNQGQPQQGQDKDKNDKGNAIDAAGDLVDNHEGWSDEEAEIIDEIIRNKVDQLSKSDKSWGRVTGGIKC